MAWLTVFLFLAACSPPTPDAVKSDALHLQPLIAEPGDGTFFAGITQIWIENGHYFLADYENSRILELDANLQFVRSLGRPGQGPGEFAGLYTFYPNDDGFYAFSDGHQKMEHFDPAGRFVATIPLPGTILLTRFFVLDSLIYLSALKQNVPIAVFDWHGERVLEIGVFQEYQNDRVTGARGGRHVFLVHHGGEPMILSVHQTAPRVDLYRLDGELVKSQSLDAALPMFRERIDFIEASYRDPGKQQATYLLFQDAYVRGHELYTLAYARSGAAKVILVFDFSSLDFTLKRACTGANLNARAIAVTSEGKITVYDAESGAILQEP